MINEGGISYQRHPHILILKIQQFTRAQCRGRVTALLSEVKEDNKRQSEGRLHRVLLPP
jgi:hypothetical protein